MYQLRPYQQDSVNATLKHFRKTNDSAVIVLPTGAGKSLVIAELAKLAKRKILVLTHVKELVEQNHQKYESYGLTAGIFSAGLKRKQTQHQVTFASIQSVRPNLEQFNTEYSLIIIDECHRVSLNQETTKGSAQSASEETTDKAEKTKEGIEKKEQHTSQYEQVINHLKQHNPDLKVLGLTATPYRLDTGWIYQYHYYGFTRTEQTVQFAHCIYELPLRYMIKNKYLTPPNIIKAAIEQYDFSSLIPGNNGEFIPKEVNELLGKYPRVTEAICEQIVQLSQHKKGIMVFAASVKHAQEIARYIKNFAPNEQTEIVTGATPNHQRDAIIQAYKAQKIKYLVNVSVLTTGFDAPHVDFIAILRPTQSVSLYQQIVGRGLRLAPGKKECLVADYAGNDFDLHYPEVGSPKPNSTSVPVMVPCPRCNFANTFWGQVDGDGDVIEHYGRRCQGLIDAEPSQPAQQCEFRFVFKECPNCHQENDIAARYCHQCDHVLVDPDDLIKQALKLKDLMVIRCAAMQFENVNNKLKIRYYDEDGLELSEQFDLQYKRSQNQFNQLFGKRYKQGREPPTFTQVDKVVTNQVHFSHPDFVIAKKQKHYWQIKERIFDYQGNHRKANAL
ncbi:DEAD/DEAH box helicase [Algibacillus agarilyticus]|uniref:DEAD/DEAH box helicase n=1 Tax=Algibacillus agarilyticus TaxID=2234133 RepID=UPI000DCF723A|nr:DEAD/DEAH box helicase family protein [Algibacillus agarilyticus]